jgi:cytochrome o ubiquinol oxidase subunit II
MESEVQPQERGPETVGLATFRRLCVVAGLALALAGCKSGVLDPQGPVGAAEKTILFNALAIMLAIVIPTSIATLAFAWWFRDSNTKARFRPDFVYSGRIELVVWSIPTLVIIFLGGITWIGSYQLDPFRPLESRVKPVEVQVVSLDWKWLFIYPEQGVATVNQLVVPAQTPIHFALTSASVMNTFFVPQLGSMIYTMNGMTTQLNLQADREGDFYGRSAHFSGDGFPGMQFTLKAVSAGAFSSWARSTAESGPTLDRDAYTALAKQSTDVAPSTYSAVEPDLFEAITTQRVPPGPGPEPQPQRDVSPREGGG